MLQYIWRNSGYLSIILTWFLVVLPFFVAKKRNKEKTLFTFSDVAVLSRYKFLMSSIIVLIGFFQILFLTYLIKNIEVNKIGGILYVFGSISLIFCAIFNKKSFPKIHYLSTRSYILLMTTALLLIGSVFGLLSTVIVIVIFTGVLILGLNKEYLFAELWLILGMSVWGLILYTYI